MLEFINVYGTKKDFSLNDISFTAEPGFITGIVGANGAGKTTLFHYIGDEKKCYTGEIRFHGADIHENHPQFRNQLGWISEEQIFFPKCTVLTNEELLSVFYENWDHDLFISALQRFEVSLYKKVSALSKGEYLKFQMAFAMAHHAKLYLIDEATSRMDPVFRKDFFKILHNLITDEDITILMSTHIEEEITTHMDYVLLLENGELKSFKEAGEQ